MKKDTKKQRERFARAMEESSDPSTPTQPCSRCDVMTESAPQGVFGNSEGKTLDPVILCRECRGLMVRDWEKFRKEGWVRYPWVRDMNKG